jgi:hypothetical protein
VRRAITWKLSRLCAGSRKASHEPSSASSLSARVVALRGWASARVFNAGATIRVRSEARNRGTNLAKRIISEADVALLVRGTRTNACTQIVDFQDWSLK